MPWCRLQLLTKIWNFGRAYKHLHINLRVGNLNTCGWVSGKRYTADMSSHITASLTCAQRLTLHVYCLLSGDFTHLISVLTCSRQCVCLMYCPAVHHYVQYIERGVYFCIPVIKVLNIHILRWCAPWANVHCALDLQCRLMYFVLSGCFVCVHCAGWCAFCATFDVHLYIVCDFLVHVCLGDQWSSNFVISKKVK